MGGGWPPFVITKQAHRTRLGMKKAALGGLFCFLLLFVLTASLVSLLASFQAGITLILRQREEKHFDTPYDPAAALTCNAICPILNLCRVIRLFVTRHTLTLCRYPLMREKCFGGEHSRATNSGRVLIAKRLRREGLLLHSPQNIPRCAPA